MVSNFSPVSVHFLLMVCLVSVHILREGNRHFFYALGALFMLLSWVVFCCASFIHLLLPISSAIWPGPLTQDRLGAKVFSRLEPSSEGDGQHIELTHCSGTSLFPARWVSYESAVLRSGLASLPQAGGTSSR